MIPISNSVSLSVRSVSGGSKQEPLGWGLSNSDVSSREMLTYAHIGATGFHADKSAGRSGAVAGGGPESAEVGRNAFQDLFNANSAAMAAAQAPVQAPRAATGASGSTEKKQPTWSVSMEGGRIQLSVNPVAR